MRALATIRWRRRDWQICPWESIRSAIISIIVVVVVAGAVDRWVFSRLEKQGVVASEGWKRHNRVVVANHHQKDRNVAFPRPKWASSAGVRAWTGFPVTKEKTKSHRLLVMGDSYVWESPYLSLNHMWWRQLGIELERRGYHDVEVIAAGTSGMSTHEELDLARYVVPEFHPDLMIWGFVTNDPDERIVKQINSSQLSLPIPGRVQVVLQKWVPRLFDLFKSRRSDKLAKCYLGPQYGYEYGDWVHRIHEGENFEKYRQTIKDVAAFLNDTQVPGLMVTLPEAPIPDRFRFSYDVVLPLWRDARIPVQDNLPGFVDRYPDVPATGPQALAWGINPADGHPGPRSTALLAKQTADRLELDYAQFLGPKSSPPVAAQINDWLPYNLEVQAQGEGQFELTYPASDDLLPTMPLEIPTVLLALQQPLPLQSIHLRGTGLKSAQAWISTYDPVEHYDTQEWKDLGAIQGGDLEWSIPAGLSNRDASVILLHADVRPDDRRLQLQLIRPADARSSTGGESPR